MIYPDRDYITSRPVDTNEPAQRIKVTENINKDVSDYYKKLKELQQLAKYKGLSRG